MVYCIHTSASAARAPEESAIGVARNCLMNCVSDCLFKQLLCLPACQSKALPLDWKLHPYTSFDALRCGSTANGYNDDRTHSI